MTACLAEDTIYQFVQGELSADAVGEVDRHIGLCADCRGVVADLARSQQESSAASTSPDEEAVAPSDVFEPGAQVGRYIVLERLAAGGMGVIYVARDPKLNRKVALKVLRADRNDRPGAQASLLREAQAMAQLSHPNVVAVYDVGSFRAGVFIAMELVDGVSLNAWLRDPHDVHDIVRVFLDAGRGLAAAHEAGIVHRDFKPHNVLVARDGRVRVTDFGLARPHESGEDEALEALADTAGGFKAWNVAMTLTRTGARKGTPAYMAPEQFLGQRTDARTDQFSYTVALYEALYGERPFRATRFEALAQEVIQGNVRAPSSPLAFPERVREILLRGLSVRPNDRYESMAGLMDAIARETSTPPALPTRTSRGKAPWAAAAGALSLVALATFWWSARPNAPSAAHVESALAAPHLTLTEPARTSADPAPDVRASSPPAEASAQMKRQPSPQHASRPVPRTPVVSAGKPRAATQARGYDDSTMEPSFAKNNH